MTKIIEKKAQSVGDILTTVKGIARKWVPRTSEPQELWFRGQSKREYQLLPGLYRKDNRQFNYDEDSLFECFKAHGLPFTSGSVSSEWDWYFLAQHHGLVTRLLDWTTNLLAAVYFAIRYSMETTNRRAYDEAVARRRKPAKYDDESPAIWMMDAGSLNVFARQNQKEDYVFVPGGKLTEKYLPSVIKGKKTRANRYPLAILPSNSNRRLIAQQGVFTVHGHKDRSIDSLASSSGKFRIRLARIILDRANLHHLWEELEYAGINRLTLFPELDSVAHINKWTGQYL